MLNVIFLLLAGASCYRFVRSGCLPMLRMMNGAPDISGDSMVTPTRGPRSGRSRRR